MSTPEPTDIPLLPITHRESSESQDSYNNHFDTDNEEDNEPNDSDPSSDKPRMSSETDYLLDRNGKPATESSALATENGYHTLTVSDIARLPNETLYTKKCMLVNREIDRMKMGRYQWSIWALCGAGYLLDLLWAQAFGLVLSPLEQEFGFNSEFHQHRYHNRWLGKGDVG